MKKLIVFIPLLFIFMSCSKEEEIQPKLSKSTIENSSSSSHLKAAEGYTLYYYGEVMWDSQCQCWKYVILWCNCLWPNTNCAPTVEITALSDSHIKQTANDFIKSYGNSTVQDFFAKSNDYQRLFPLLDDLKGVVDSISNSQIILNYFYNKRDSTAFYIGLPAGKTLSDTIWNNNVSCVLRIKDKR